MNFRNLSTRELITIIAGATIVAVFLLWIFVIDVGKKKLEKDHRKVLRYTKNVRAAKLKLYRKNELETEYMELIASYSNQLDKIGDMIIPVDIDDRLRVEFDKVDRRYSSNIGRTTFKKETNEVFNLLKYQLSQVLCNWKSLNAALYLIENSGQLVGFENLTISADARDKRDVKARVQMIVESFIFPDRGTKPWEMPDYTVVENDIGRNIFQIPEDMIPAAKGKGGKDIKELSKIPWTRNISFTGIVKFGGKLYAVFYNKAEKRACRISLGGTISNTTATITAIDPVGETINLDYNGEDIPWPLRKYREDMYKNKTPVSLLTGFRRSSPELAAQPEINEEEIETETPVPVTEKTEVPENYEKKMGSFTDCVTKIRAFIQKVDKYNKRRFRLNSDYGIILTRITKTSPLLKAGLQRRDIILDIDGKRVDSNATFTYALNLAYANGTSVPMTIMRGKKTMKVTVDFQ